jgi:hypothetical protein
MEIHRSFRPRVTDIVKDSFHSSVPVGAVVATRTRPALEVTTALDELRLGKVLNTRYPLCSIRSVLPGCGHLSSLQARSFFLPEEIGLKGPPTEENPQYLSYSLDYLTLVVPDCWTQLVGPDGRGDDKAP